MLIKLKIEFNDELITYKRLYFLTEKRNLSKNDYEILNNNIYFSPNISKTLFDLLLKLQIHDDYAPIWIEGITRALFSDDAKIALEILDLDSNEILDIPYLFLFNQVLIVKRSHYQRVKELNEKLKQYKYVYIDSYDRDRYKRIKISHLTKISENIYEIPHFLDVRTVESYLLGFKFFVINTNKSFTDIKILILKNLNKTISRRIIGNRELAWLKDFGYIVILDSVDELISLLRNIQQTTTVIPEKPYSGYTLQFPYNSNIPNNLQSLWRQIIPLGTEDIHLEGSYFRETGQMDESYKIYREKMLMYLFHD